MEKHHAENSDDLMAFFNHSPTAWHAVENGIQILEKHGFKELDEKKDWELKPHEKHFVRRNGSSLCAFVVPQTIVGAKVIASHTDSPSLKLKPNSEYRKENMVMLGVEVYGGPLLSSWLNRDLGIAGRVFYHDQNDGINCSLVNLHENPVFIPQLAIHLDRQVNETGLVLNKQEHLNALAGLDLSYDPSTSYLEGLINKKIPLKKILSSDLFLYPLEKASYVGYNKQMIASYRVDNLASVHAALTAITAIKKNISDTLKLAIFWDHEEVGSETTQGASSTFFMHIFERICLSLNYTREQFLKILSNSACVSTDLAHALHPNNTDKHDARHQVLLNRGIVIKNNAQQRYASNAQSVSSLIDLCQKNEIPYQFFVSRNDLPCGSTIGPIFASNTGISTVDIGIPQLSMHSSREIFSYQDQVNMMKLLTNFLK